MKSLLPSTLNPQPSTSPQEQRVLAACRAANAHERDYVIKACIAGALLLEFRETLLNPSDPSNSSYPPGNPAHGGPGSPNTSLRHHKATPLANNFTFWVESHDIAITTAKRWMSAAENASRFALNLCPSQLFSTTIDVEGVEVLLSQALTSPDAELSGKALKFKQGFLSFMSDKTLFEAARGVVDGESAGSRIAKAAAGKTRGGKGDLNRKEFALFAGRSLSDCLHHIGANIDKKGGHWRSLDSVSKQQARDYLLLFVKGLPDELIEFLSEATRLQRALRSKGQLAEPLALKQAVDQVFTAKEREAAKSRKPHGL